VHFVDVCFVKQLIVDNMWNLNHCDYYRRGFPPADQSGTNGIARVPAVSTRLSWVSIFRALSTCFYFFFSQHVGAI